MKKVRLSELTEPVRQFLDRVFAGGGVVVEDNEGRTRGSFVPYRDPTPEEERRADESLARLRQKTSAAMKEAGVTEDDVMRELLEDD
jgi:hypothetical protein